MSEDEQHTFLVAFFRFVINLLWEMGTQCLQHFSINCLKWKIYFLKGVQIPVVSTSLDFTICQILSMWFNSGIEVPFHRVVFEQSIANCETNYERISDEQKKICSKPNGPIFTILHSKNRKVPHNTGTRAYTGWFYSNINLHPIIFTQHFKWFLLLIDNEIIWYSLLCLMLIVYLHTMIALIHLRSAKR